jgi:saxitoxin biosynthesis operon SxtJ-like protein
VLSSRKKSIPPSLDSLREALVVHPEVYRRNDAPGVSNRKFGVTIGMVCLAFAIWPMFFGASVRSWLLVLGASLIVSALVRPQLLGGINRAWMRLADLLHRLVSPVALGIIFYCSVVPTALVLRLLGKDPLHRRFDTRLTSYWVERSPPDPRSGGMSDQF